MIYRGDPTITFFFIVAQVVAYLSFFVGWFRGGHPERFGAGILLLDYLVTALIFYRPIGNAHAIEVASEASVTLIFIWLAFRSSRWWSLVAAASLMLCVMVHFLEWVVSDFSRYAAESAQLGLWVVTYLALLGGVFERWLAGEAAVSNKATWRRRRAVT